MKPMPTYIVVSAPFVIKMKEEEKEPPHTRQPRREGTKAECKYTVTC